MPMLLQIPIFSQTKAKKTFAMNKGTKGNHSGSHKMIWIILKLEEDILMLSIVSKFL